MPRLFKLTRRLALLSLAVTPPLAAHAQAADVTAALARLPPDLAEKLTARPDRWLAVALEAIHGHGQGGAVTQADLDRALALDRAFFRARALQPLLEADLDNDAAVTRDEAAARAAMLGLAGRVRLMRLQAEADADGDGTASAAELRDAAEVAALAGSEGAEAALRASLLSLDLDGDARLSLIEVETIATALQDPG